MFHPTSRNARPQRLYHILAQSAKAIALAAVILASHASAAIPDKNEPGSFYEALVPLNGADTPGNEDEVLIRQIKDEPIVVKTFKRCNDEEEDGYSDAQDNYEKELKANVSLSELGSGWPDNVAQCLFKDDAHKTLFFQQYDASMSKFGDLEQDDIEDCALQVFRGFRSVLNAGLFHGDIMNTPGTPNLGNILRKQTAQGNVYALHDFGMSGQLIGNEDAAFKDILGLVHIFSNNYKISEVPPSFNTINDYAETMVCINTFQTGCDKCDAAPAKDVEECNKCGGDVMSEGGNLSKDEIIALCDELITHFESKKRRRLMFAPYEMILPKNQRRRLFASAKRAGATRVSDHLADRLRLYDTHYSSGHKLGY